MRKMKKQKKKTNTKKTTSTKKKRKTRTGEKKLKSALRRLDEEAALAVKKAGRAVRERSAGRDR